MFKKSYIAYYNTYDNKPAGTVVIRSWFWKSPTWFHRTVIDIVDDRKVVIIKFERLK
jgi:hypothetical protein